MEAISRLDYSKRFVNDAETDIGYVVKQTLDQGLDDGGVLCFRFPVDSHRFTDLNTMLLRVNLSIRNPNGTEVDWTNANAKHCLLDHGGMHSLFSSVEVKFGETSVSTMTNYVLSTALLRMLGTAQELRNATWDSMDGTRDLGIRLRSSILGDQPTTSDQQHARQHRANCTLIGRVFSDILMSSRQYLPPGVALTVLFRRAPNSVSLLSNDAATNYKVHISSASLYAKRLSLRPSVIPQTLENLKNESFITFNRLQSRLITIPANSGSFRWLDCLNSESLPNRLYLAFISTAALYGKYTVLSTFFESLNVKSLNMKVDGRDLLVEPIKVNYTYGANGNITLNASDGREGYLTVAEVLNQVSDATSSLRLSYLSYLMGSTFYVIELGKCGEKSGTTASLDIEVPNM